MSLYEEIHPQIRFTTRLEYFDKVENRFEHDYIFMNSDQYDRQFYEIIAERKEEINRDLISYAGSEYEITEWGYDSTENDFSMNEVLSNKVISLLKNDEYAQILVSIDYNTDLALAYLSELRYLYTKEQVAKAILSVITRKPNVEIVKRILNVWDVSLTTDTNIEMRLKILANSNEMDLALGKLLVKNNADNLKILKSKLNHLNEEWNLNQEKNKHRLAILLYRFFVDYPLINRNNVSLKEGLKILSVYLNISISTYTKEVQLIPYYGKSDKDGKEIPPTPMEARKNRIYSQINSRWATFKALYLK